MRPSQRTQLDRTQRRAKQFRLSEWRRGRVEGSVGRNCAGQLGPEQRSDLDDVLRPGFEWWTEEGGYHGERDHSVGVSFTCRHSFLRRLNHSLIN